MRTAAELVHRPAAWLTLVLLVAGIVLLLVGVGMGDERAGLMGSATFFAGTLALVAHYAVIFARR